MEDFSKGNKFRNLDVHTVSFQFGIGTFGHRNSHQVQFCDNLILGKFIRITDGLYIFAFEKIGFHATAVRIEFGR